MAHRNVMTIYGSPVRPGWVAALLLLIVVIGVFHPVTSFDFVVWDDDLHVYANPHLYPFTWSNLGTFWRAPYAHLYIPLTYTLWAAIAWMHEAGPAVPLSAAPFHRLNLLLHGGSVLLVYRIGILLLSPRKPPSPQTVLASTLAALVFGLHPLQVEAVAWVSGLKDVLCGWWSVVALWQYLVFVQSQQRWKRLLHYGMATGAFVCALLAKPTAVAVPVMAGLLAIGGLQQPWQQAWRALSGWLLVALGWSIWIKTQQPDIALTFITPLWSRPFVALDSMTFYLGKLLWPTGLGPDYGRTPQIVMEQGRGVLTGLVPFGFGAMLWWRRKCWQGFCLTGAVCLVALAPVLGFIPFMFQAYSTVADRYVYLAMIGVAFGVGWWLQRLGRWPGVWIAAALCVSLFAWRSAVQVHIWRDTAALLTHALQVNPKSVMAHNNLGLVLAQEGRLNEALTSFQTAVQLRPDFPEAHYNLGKAFTMQGKFTDAITHHEAALQLRPGWAEAHNNLGVTLAAQGQHHAALVQYAKALILKPAWPEVYYNMGNVFFQQGRIPEAVASYRTALPGRAVWLAATTRLAQLLTRYYASAPHYLREAVELAEQVCRATDYQDATALYTLALAYHTSGQSSRAAHTAETALPLAKAHGNVSLAQEIAALLPRDTERFPHYEVP